MKSNRAKRIRMRIILLSCVVGFGGSPAHAQNAGSPLGTNLTLVNPSSTEWAFQDAFKTSWAWVPECAPNYNPNDDCTASGDTGEASLLDLDAHGWVRSLPAPQDPP